MAWYARCVGVCKGMRACARAGNLLVSAFAACSCAPRVTAGKTPRQRRQCCRQARSDTRVCANAAARRTARCLLRGARQQHMLPREVTMRRDAPPLLLMPHAEGWAAAARLPLPTRTGARRCACGHAALAGGQLISPRAPRWGAAALRGGACHARANTTFARCALTRAAVGHARHAAVWHTRCATSAPLRKARRAQLRAHAMMPRLCHAARAAAC